MVYSIRYASAVLFVAIVTAMAQALASPGTPTPSSFLKTLTATLDGFDVRVTYDPRTTKIINKSDGETVATYLLIATRIGSSDPRSYTISFSAGPSGDAEFTIGLEGGAERIGSVYGTELTVPGNGFVYVSGHVNNMFNTRRKFAVSGTVLNEIQQPFYYVGVDSTAVRALTLTFDKDGDRVVATVLAGSPVTVLVADGNHYLVKTQHGIVGWVYIEDIQERKYIKDLFFNGD